MLARVEITTDVQPGQLFVPMHWSEQFAARGRVGVLVNAATDPHSGQPELKHTPVSLRPYRVAWYAFAITREPMESSEPGYCVKARGDDYWRYELAGDTPPDSWEDWARNILGADGEWVEFADAGAGRYRGARLADGRLQACLFVAVSPELPGREWLGALFNDDALNDAARMSILAGRPANAATDAGPVVCACFSVGRNTLIQAIRNQQLVSTEEIGKTLNAGTNCGSCIPELNALISGNQ
jgi:assimilatory nitrate reductase catalytic subunit